MPRSRGSGARAGWGARSALARTPLALIVLLGASGCAGAPRIEVPSTLPNVTRESFLTLRWALLRQGGTTRAVGVAEASSTGQWDATVDLLGVDEAGRTVSRGSTAVRPGFAPGEIPFEASLVETGREAAFRLAITRAHQYSRPSR